MTPSAARQPGSGPSLIPATPGRVADAVGRPTPFGRPAAPLSRVERWLAIAVNAALLLAIIVAGPCLLWWALVEIFLTQLARFAP